MSRMLRMAALTLALLQPSSALAEADSRAAELYLQGKLAEAPELHAQIEAYRATASGVPLHELGPLLQRVSQRISPDVAALLFAELAQERAPRVDWRAQASNGDRSVVVLAAPAFLYKSKPETGADLQRVLDVARGLGFRAERIALGEAAVVEDNARLIAEELQRRRAAGETVVLVTGSKSSAEAAEALGRLLKAEESAHVRAWINAAGVLRGTPLADEAANGFARFGVSLAFASMGHGMAGIDSLRTEPRRAAFATLAFPSVLRIVNVVGVPLSSDISKENRMNYARLKKFGPNDGVVLLTDAIVPGAITLSQAGADHYMGKSADADALGALLLWASQPGF